MDNHIPHVNHNILKSKRGGGRDGGGWAEQGSDLPIPHTPYTLFSHVAFAAVVVIRNIAQHSVIFRFSWIRTVFSQIVFLISWQIEVLRGTQSSMKIHCILFYRSQKDDHQGSFLLVYSFIDLKTDYLSFQHHAELSPVSCVYNNSVKASTCHSLLL